MNIFVLHTDPKICAEYHCDKHVVKMILETAQMRCTNRNKPGQSAPYKSVHSKHPCTLWVGTSLSNWLWVKSLSHYLNIQYKLRYKSEVNHKSYDVIANLPNPNIQDIGLTPFYQAMPDPYKHPNPVVAYRTYYLNDKRKFAKWSISTPIWWSN